MITVYVREQGAVIRLVSKRLKIEKGDAVLQIVRLRDLERLVLVGTVDLTAPAMAALLENGIETTLLSYGGKFRGRLQPAEGKNIFLRLAQFRRYDDMEFRLRVGRSIVEAKIRNARALVQRHSRNHPEVELAETIAKLDSCRRNVPGQTSLDALMGVEGDAAKHYFSVLGTMVRSEFTFQARSRRPPRDPVNALLSFGYTLLTTEVAGAVAAQGLDIHVGFLHDLAYGRPSLALDILEEFRQPVVDRLVLSLVNRGVLKPEHFEDRGEFGILLNDEGRPRFFDFYHQTLDARFALTMGAASGQEVSYRDLIGRQAFAMRQVISGIGEYVPYFAR